MDFLLSKIMKSITKKLRGYEISWYSDMELLTIFPELRGLISSKIPQLEKIVKEKEKEISKELDRINGLRINEFSKWFSREIVKMEYVPELQKCDWELFNLKRYLQLFNPNHSKKHIQNFQEKIEIAKNYPIYELASRFMELKQCGNKYSGHCPYHEDRHASFFIFSDTNSYYCFSCQKGGSVINLTMELYSTDFKSAVKILDNE